MGRFGRAWRSGGTGNRRVHNARKTLLSDGGYADSALEAMMYERLLGSGIQFEYHRRFILQDKLEYRGELVRSLSWYADFYFPWCGVVLDTKGYATDVAKIKLKLFKGRYGDLKLIIARNRSEVEAEYIYLLALWQKHQRG